MVLVEGKYFRVNQIGEDIKKGLGLEFKSNSDTKTIAYIVPLVTEGICKMSLSCIEFKDVNFESVKCLDSTNPLMIEEYKNCVEFARNALRDILCK
jgi:hypothetical protein